METLYRQFDAMTDDGARVIAKNIFFWEGPRNRPRQADFNWRPGRNRENNNHLLCPESLSPASHRESRALIREREARDAIQRVRETRAKHVQPNYFNRITDL